MSFAIKRFQEKHLILWGAILVVFVLVIPLVGLVVGMFEPPRSPFVAETPSFITLFKQTGAFGLLINTVVLALLVSILSVGVGLWFAWAEQRTDYPGVRWLGILNLLPLAMPSFLLAIALQAELGPSGLIGGLFNLPPFRGFIPAIFVLTLVMIPYVQLIISAALKRSSIAEEEAAQCLGASNNRLFWKIVFPYLRPSIAFAWLIVVLHMLGEFGAVAILDTQVFTWRLYQAVEHQQLHQATLFGFIVMLIAIPWLYWREHLMALFQTIFK